jgi:hypothetical protein
MNCTVDDFLDRIAVASPQWENGLKPQNCLDSSEQMHRNEPPKRELMKAGAIESQRVRREDKESNKNDLQKCSIYALYPFSRFFSLATATNHSHSEIWRLLTQNFVTGHWFYGNLTNLKSYTQNIHFNIFRNFFLFFKLVTSEYEILYTFILSFILRSCFANSAFINSDYPKILANTT